MSSSMLKDISRPNRVLALSSRQRCRSQYQGMQWHKSALNLKSMGNALDGSYSEGPPLKPWRTRTCDPSTPAALSWMHARFKSGGGLSTKLPECWDQKTSDTLIHGDRRAFAKLSASTCKHHARFAANLSRSL